MNKKALIIAEDSKSLILTRKEIIISIIETGYQCDVAVPGDAHCVELENLGCHIIEIDFNRRGMNPIDELKLLKQYQALIKRSSYEFVITYSIKPNIYGGLSARIAKIPYYINITGMGSALCNPGAVRFISKTLYKLSSKKANGVFFENTENRKQFIEWNLCTESNSFSFPGAGINLSEFEYSPKIQGEHLIFLFIGRLMDEKGVNELCRTAERVYPIYPNVIFQFAGEFEDNFKKKFYNCYAKIPNIEYLGYCDNIKERIKNADCVILPSYHEGMANVLLEGCAIGRPILASNIPGCREAIVNRHSGMLFEAKDENSLYDAVIDFIKLSSDERLAYGQNSRMHVEKYFDRRNIVNKIMKIVTGTE